MAPGAHRRSTPARTPPVALIFAAAALLACQACEPKDRCRDDSDCLQDRRCGDDGRCHAIGAATDSGRATDAAPATDAAAPDLLGVDSTLSDGGVADVIDRDAGDCRTDGCQGLRYCDPESGQCLPGCERHAQCGQNQECNLLDHVCVCQSGFHDCAGFCVSNRSIDSCGNSCSPCPTDPDGITGCDGVSCSLECNPGTRLCDAACADCPEAATETSCDSDRCVATGCSAGHLLREGACAAFSLETVAEPGENYSLGIGVDAAGTPHLAWVSRPPSGTEPRNRQVRYATRAQGGWTTEVVHTTTERDLIWDLDLAVTAEGTPHLYFYSTASSTCAHAQRAGDAFEQVPFDLGANVEIRAWSLNPEERSRAAIWIFDPDGGLNAIRLAEEAPGTWGSVEILALDIYEFTSRMTFRWGSATSHLVYELNDSGGRNNYLRYATGAGASWSSASIDYGWSHRLEVAADGTPYVAFLKHLYLDTGEIDVLHLATPEGEQWHSDEVLERTAITYDLALCRDQPVLAVFDPEVATLSIVHRDAEGWRHEVVAGDLSVASLRLSCDAGGAPSVAFLEGADPAQRSVRLGR